MILERTDSNFEDTEEKIGEISRTFQIAQLEKQIVNEKIMNEDELETLEERMREENERLLESNKVLKVEIIAPLFESKSTLQNQLQAILQMDKMAGAEIPIENTDKKN